MAEKVGKLETYGTAVSLFAAVFISNWLSAQYLNYPFIWCFGKWAIQPIIEPWIFVSHFMALAYFIACIVTPNIMNIVKGMAVVVVVFGLPMFLEILFRLGKSCG